MRVSVVATGISAMAAQQPAAELRDARHEPADADRPAGAQPFGRAAGRPRRHAGGGCRARRSHRGTADRAHGRRRSAGDGARGSPRAGRCRAHRAGTGGTADPGDGRDADPGPDRRSAGRAGAPHRPRLPLRHRSRRRCLPLRRSRQRQRPLRSRRCAPPRPLVDENDWRVSRPAAKPAVRASEPIARPVAARAASESRAPNLFQRITGAFAAPKPRQRLRPSSRWRSAAAPENVVAVAPEAAAAAGPGAGFDQSRRHRARQACAR